MKGKKRHSPEQIIREFEVADMRLNAGRNIAPVCRVLEVGEAQFHRWGNQYGGMKAQEAKRLKELEKENAKLKKPAAELVLDKDGLIRPCIPRL